jgi:hypothetical protein
MGAYSSSPKQEGGRRPYWGSEPAWTRQIPSWAICDWFFFFFLMNAFVIVLLLLSVVYMALTSRTLLYFNLAMLFVQLLVSGTGTLFYYLLCDRSLKPSQ